MSGMKRTPYQRGITLEEARQQAHVARAALEKNHAYSGGLVNVTAGPSISHQSHLKYGPVDANQARTPESAANQIVSSSKDKISPAFDQSVDHSMGEFARSDLSRANRSGASAGSQLARYSSLAGTHPANYSGVNTSRDLDRENANIDPCLLALDRALHNERLNFSPGPNQGDNRAHHGAVPKSYSNDSIMARGFRVAHAISNRHKRVYVSPYTAGSTRYSVDTGNSQDRKHTVDEPAPGHSITTTPESLYPEPESLAFVGSLHQQQSRDSQRPANEKSPTDTAPSDNIDSQMHFQADQEVDTDLDRYIPPDEYFAFLKRASPEMYCDSPEQKPQSHSATRNGMFEQQENASYKEDVPKNTICEGIAPDEHKMPQNLTTSRKRKYSVRKNGTLYDKRGHLPLPVEQYREYMNGIREMNGKHAQPELAIIPCQTCAMQGLVCKMLTRNTDRGKVFTSMRKPWHNQEVANYIVCANCWQSGRSQTCSFWRRPEGKEEAAHGFK